MGHSMGSRITEARELEWKGPANAAAFINAIQAETDTQLAIEEQLL